jgi:hypothetical protein
MNGVKYTYEEVREFVNNLGYNLISNEYINYSQKLVITDNVGYYYVSRLNDLKSGYKPLCFAVSNPYTIYNIKLWLQLNNNKYILISNEYNSGSKLIIKDTEGYYYYLSLYHLLKSNNLNKFDAGNKFTIHNIKLWCKKNNKPFELLSVVYEGNKKSLEWKCLKENCGEIFKASWNQIHRGTGCGVCAGRQVKLSNCLATKNPELTKEWHPIKNGNLTPYDVSCNSHKKVWWQCSKNPTHEWQSIVSNRNNGNGCPYCSGRRASEDYNLLLYNPELCKEWDYEKNDKKPEDYTPYSEEKVWWKCLKDSKHQWFASIASRNSGKDCPYCAKLLPTEDYNLLICNPILCEEWNYDKNIRSPKDYMPNSHISVFWKCTKCNYEWKAKIQDRNNGSGCPKCNNSKGEQRISKYLIQNGFIEITQKDYDNLNHVHKISNNYYIPQKTFNDLMGLNNGLLSYDFYLPKYNLLIEYQGEQHEKYIECFHKAKKGFEKQQEHDKRKREYAQKHNIKLLEIWYWDFDNIESILQKELNLQEVVSIA